MSYKCCDCGRIFDEPKEYDERIGEFWGAPVYERFACCPYCDGDFDDYERYDEEDEEYEDA